MAIRELHMLSRLMLRYALFHITVKHFAVSEHIECGPCNCEGNAADGFIVDCSSKALTEVPTFGSMLISDIIELNLSNNNLSRLTANFASPFEGFDNLTKLDLSKSSISMNGQKGSVINSMTFAGLDSLEVLDVSNNHNLPFTNLTDSNLFKNLTSLKILRMYGTTNASNAKEGYPNKLWSNVPTLEEIWIDGLPFVGFGEEFKQMPNLTNIRISGDLLDPPFLDHDYCNIGHISNEMLNNLEHVSKLSIVHCNVLSISKLAFDGVKSLTGLDLSWNFGLGLGFGFGEIPSVLPPKLETLDVHSSSMGPAIHDYINNNNSLKNVYASNAFLVNCWAILFPESISLRHLDLSSNLCSDIDRAAFWWLPSLQFLDLSGNYFSFAMTNYGRLFENNIELQYLNISRNELKILNKTLFKNQINMKYLDLSQNKLKSFGIYADNFTKLKVLNLSQNCLLTLTEFKQILHVIGNNVENINETVLDLRNNDFLCSCNDDDVAFMKIVAEDVLHQRQRYFLQFTCNETEVTNVRDFESFKINFDNKCRTYTFQIVFGVVCVIILLNIIVGTLVYKFRWKIKYWFYVRNSKRRLRNGYTVIQDSNNWSYKYHVYLAYSYEVQEFIADTVIPKLSELGYKVFSQEDIIPGLNLCSVIGNAIHVSRCVLFVVGSDCSESNEWCIAVHMVNEEAIQRGKHITLALLYDYPCIDGIPGAERLIHKDYFIDFPRHGSGHEVTAFWVDFENKLISIDNTAIETSMTCQARDNESF